MGVANNLEYESEEEEQDVYGVDEVEEEVVQQQVPAPVQAPVQEVALAVIPDPVPAVEAAVDPLVLKEKPQSEFDILFTTRLRKQCFSRKYVWKHSHGSKNQFDALFDEDEEDTAAEILNRYW